MIDEKMSVVLRKLTVLASCLNAIIDSGQHTSVSYEAIYSQIENKTIFEYLATIPEASWGIGNLSSEDKWHLTGEWQSMANAIDAERKLGVSSNGICLLLAYVIEGIQMRTFGEEVWPGPEPW